MGEPMAMNRRRGFFRIWVVAVLAVGFLSGLPKASKTYWNSPQHRTSVGALRYAGRLRARPLAEPDHSGGSFLLCAPGAISILRRHDTCGRPKRSLARVASV